MKRINKMLLLVAAICLVAGSSESFGQLRLGGGGNRRSFSSGNQRSGNSFKSQSSGISKNSGLGRSTSKSFVNRQFGSRQNLSGISRVNPSIGKTLINKSGIVNRKPGVSSGLAGRLSGLTAGKAPRIPAPGNSAVKGLPKVPNGIAGQIKGIVKGGNSGTQNKTAGNARWKDLARHIVKTSLHRNHWCHTRPNTCLWWNAYCQPIAQCHHHEVVVCNWSRVRCGTTALPTHEVQWYLGLKGILLPGRGLGIDTVEPGSPAAQVGLQPGMVMTVCNGISLVDETSLQQAIRTSGGILQMTLMSADGSQVLEGTVQMARISSVSF